MNDLKNITIEDIKEKIGIIVDPIRNDTLANLQAIKHVGIDSEKNVVVLIIAINRNNSSETDYLKRALAKIIKLDLGFDGIKIQFEEAKVISARKAKFILIEGGKGGTGKSTVACNLAYSLKKLGYKTGIIDADMYGASIPTLLNIPTNSLGVNEYEKIIPYNFEGIEVVSVEFFNNVNEPVLWKGSLLVNMLNNFLYQVAWNKDLDYIIVDTPSDTGEIILELKTLLPDASVILVTTPHLVSAHTVVKAGIACKELKQPIIGVIENMTSFPVNENEEGFLDRNGGIIVSNNLDIDLLASIPLMPATHHQSLYEEDEENGRIYKDIATLISIRE